MPKKKRKRTEETSLQNVDVNNDDNDTDRDDTDEIVLDDEEVEYDNDDHEADVSSDREHETCNEDDDSSLSSNQTSSYRNSDVTKKRDASVLAEDILDVPSPKNIDINDIPPFPTMEMDLEQQYELICNDFTYHRITVKDSNYYEIPPKLYQRAIVATYKKFCKFCSDEFEHYLLCNDDEEGNLRRIILEEHGEKYKSHDINTWWLDLPEQTESIIQYLQVLCVNSVWSLGYRMSISVTEAEFSSVHYLPCWCPCHKRFKPYYDHMNNAFLSHNECLECSRSKAFQSPRAFKAHLHDTDDWIHKLILFFVTELYENKCLPYSEGHIQPIPPDHRYASKQKSVSSIPVSSHKTKG